MSRQGAWVVQVLTMEYVIDGYVEAGGAAALALLPASAHTTGPALALAPARMQATGLLSVSIQEVAECVIPRSQVLVAVMPRDPASTQYLLGRLRGNAVHPIRAVVYVGPYGIRGTLISPWQDLDSTIRPAAFAMQDVEIDHLARGAALHALQAPWVMIHSQFVHAAVPF